LKFHQINWRRTVKKIVWTGEYERDQNGQIIEEISHPAKKQKRKNSHCKPSIKIIEFGTLG